MSYAAAKRFSLDFLAQVELADKADVQISKLSSGQQQKIQLGITIINQPQLLILDEPTKGLDPVNRDLLMRMLLDFNKNGATIVFSTHQMNEAEKIAHRLLMIKDGTRALYGELNEVKRGFGSNVIHLQYSGKLSLAPKLFDAVIEPNTAVLTPKEGIASAEILAHLVAARLDIQRFEVATPTLDEIFIKVSKEAA
jgi:ABC-2 type transport system ATP-binding protein